MSLVFCPECGSKISSKACVCPQCGYCSSNQLMPISEQENCQFIQPFSCEVNLWNGQTEVVDLSYEDSKSLSKFFSKFENIKQVVPQLAILIEEMAKRKSVLMAKIDPYIQTLIDSGAYKFCIDKSGEILPTIMDETGFKHIVRLEKISQNQDVMQSFNNLSSQAMMVQLMNKIDLIENSIKMIGVDMQNDRIAKAEAAYLKLIQAKKIQDSYLRNIQVLNIVNDSIEARCILMKNFETKLKLIKDHSKKGIIKKLSEPLFKDKTNEAISCFEMIVAITNLVQVECEAYRMQGEINAAKEVLVEFKEFILKNELNNEDVLLLINEHVEHNSEKMVNEFIQIANGINDFEKRLTQNKINFLIEGYSNED